MNSVQVEDGGAPGSRASGGVALLLNAAASKIIRVTMSTAPDVSVDLPGMALFPVSGGVGATTISGCSFAIPVDTTFTLTVLFETGEQVLMSTRTPSQASPALYFVAFLNGLVATRPNGRASDIQFVSGSSQGLSISGDVS